ncbi:hypothetical protein [Dyadobacter sp. CY323]|uniref:hypothetical protein n=1 Tax=Dyadobacter sp. CY323 TaxID=2907302 RepID=UPI001F3F5BA4|nr:hypothetical protein [Dyadobacter sp. CY323]MCE6987466.1 hypothetical protein [Dyadobacter sp. CY323]
MEESQESTTESIPVFNADRFDIHKLSRWTDNKGRLMVVAGFYHGTDPRQPYSAYPQRVGLDLLIVEEERVEYMDIHRFIYFVINGKIQPWKKVQPEKPLEEMAQKAA